MAAGGQFEGSRRGLLQRFSVAPSRGRRRKPLYRTESTIFGKARAAPRGRYRRPRRRVSFDSGTRGLVSLAVAKVKEIREGQTNRAAAAMLTLRPRWQTRDALVEFIDTDLRPRGYRLAGVFDDDPESAASVIGFREQWSTAWGHYLYVDDLSTTVGARGRGYADMLVRWVIAEARRVNCEAIHLDSGVGEERAAAHRLYMQNHFQIASHHFAHTFGQADGNQRQTVPQR